MTDREKLIELLKHIPQVNHYEAQVEGINYVFGCAADYLLANDVTFQKWIPVSERLPEHGKVVLVCGKRGAIYTAWCNSLYKNPGWHKLNSKNHYCDPTHWMPLPEPPKEDNL